MTTKLTYLLFLLTACAGRSSAQIGFDASGDAMLSGTYYMRQVFYIVSAGTITRSMNVQGTITFSGAGSYSFNGALVDTAATPPSRPLAVGGTYAISASGEGYLSAVNTEFPSDKIYGLVSHNIFIGCSTKTPYGYNDLFIAAPVGSIATNATLNGGYSVAYMDPTLPGDAFFTMTADGQGNVGTVNATGYIGSSSTAATQSLSGVTYSFSNGAANLKFGGKASSTTLLSGNQLLYISPDGNFIFGGSYTGYDMFAGVRAASSAPSNYEGFYYQAGLQMDEASSSPSVLDNYYGSFKAFSGKILGQESMGSGSQIKYGNLNTLSIYGGSSDFAYYDTYTVNSDGSSADNAFAQHYVSSTDGTIRIGYGIGPFLSLNIAFQAPSFSGSGVYLSPVGVVNAGSSAPFTAFISPGEFLTLYGSGLAPTTASASVPYPKMLSGVQVLINQVAAPINYVSPTQISVIVPYSLGTYPVAQIQVVNNGVNSNPVTQFTALTSPGVFTSDPVGGLGYAAALHPDYSVISPSSPAQIGETVAVYLSGMGEVIPPVVDGRAASSTSLSYTTANPQVFLEDSAGHYLQANVTFSGLAPGYAGLYQMNLTIPSGLISGDASVEIVGPDSDTFEALLPLTTTTSDHR